MTSMFVLTAAQSNTPGLWLLIAGGVLMFLSLLVSHKVDRKMTTLHAIIKWHDYSKCKPEKMLREHYHCIECANGNLEIYTLCPVVLAYQYKEHPGIIYYAVEKRARYANSKEWFWYEGRINESTMEILYWKMVEPIDEDKDYE